jgi:hypothetical protein
MAISWARANVAFESAAWAQPAWEGLRRVENVCAARRAGESAGAPTRQF